MGSGPPQSPFWTKVSLLCSGDWLPVPLPSFPSKKNFSFFEGMGVPIFRDLLSICAWSGVPLVLWKDFLYTWFLCHLPPPSQTHSSLKDSDFFFFLQVLWLLLNIHCNTKLWLHDVWLSLNSNLISWKMGSFIARLKYTRSGGLEGECMWVCWLLLFPLLRSLPGHSLVLVNLHFTF